MIATQTALTVPPKAVLAVIMNACFFLASCGGGGGGMAGTITPPPSTTASLSPAALRPIILFDGFEHFETAQNQAIAIDVATGQVTPLPDEATQRRYLNKQPSPFDDVSYASVDTAAARYAGLSYLSHDLSAQSGLSGQIITLGDVNQSDPGQFLLFGKVGPLPVESARFQLQGRYFCSHCQQNFGTAPGALIFYASAQSAQFELANGEIALSIQLTIQDGDLQSTLEQPPLFHKQGLNQTITDYHALGTFFGPEAQQTGLLFSLIQEHGILTGAAIGLRP